MNTGGRQRVYSWCGQHTEKETMKTRRQNKQANNHLNWRDPSQLDPPGCEIGEIILGALFLID